ncbi:MAG: aminotransferase class I/II-fold pyridoxal phosphate-dependent enzyme [Candidatus Gracilibacteria bacterium]|nr:aminotransferase class I/II-fold pyridoxal phosphate-dependent enzyme [Candidatus Gracilibacteria bacterium]
MFKKTLIAEFFTTINFHIFMRTIGLLTLGLPKLRYGNYTSYLENQFLSYIGSRNSKIVSFYNGRSALFHALKMIGINSKDEVIVSAYTCVSVSNAVIQSGAKIVYSDIDIKNLGLDIDNLNKNINKNTKVIIVQHTFGKPANIKKIIEIAKEKNILIIEDCAHSLGSRIDGKKLGSFGDFSIFSTGRDKVISGVTGGFLIVNNEKYFDKIIEIKEKLKMPGRVLTIKNLFYNITAYLSYKFYDFLGLGKIIIFLSRKLNIITEILTIREKNCDFNDFNLLLPNSLAYLASKEFQKTKLYSTHRRTIAEYYDEKIKSKYIKILFHKSQNEKNNYFRYPIIIQDETKKNKLYNYMKKHNILLGNSWSGINIVPIGSNLKKSKYIVGSCKNAEHISKHTLLLPNHKLIGFEDAKKITKLINNFLK